MLGLPRRHGCDNFGAVPDNAVDEDEENIELIDDLDVNEENEENIEFIDDPDVRQYITKMFEPEYVHNSSDEFEDTGDNEAGKSMHISSPTLDINTTTSKRKAPLSDKFLHRKKQKKISTTKTIRNNTALQTETASLKKMS
ncbi:uncharacterized protein LOC118647551 [Monomorium pharaonis]|uniref:uncharacterized protein LOC118647551 n=1 Tax=Monomorium pharaonis TaxID=307658 RepID=UPI0017472CC4|nr:uncharacterized protein LOC118647551 [Monomorium pharaonis]